MWWLSSRRAPRAVTFAAVLAVVAAASARPAHARDEWFGRDKALHFGASAAIAVGGYGGTALFTPEERPRLYVGGGLALLAGVGKEIADRYTGGDPSLRDLTWDVIGTASGLTVAWLIDRIWHGVRDPRGSLR